MYATYEDYTIAYHGNTVPETDWERLEQKAAAYIDQITYDRLKGCSVLPKEVVLAVCAVAEIVAEEESSARAARKSAGVKSFSNDGYSETLNSPAKVRNQYAAEKREAAEVFLPLSHPLRYAGIP